MTRKDALLEYAAIVCQIELLKLKLPPLERILLQTETPAVRVTAREVIRRYEGTPSNIIQDTFDVLVRIGEPASAKQVAKELNIKPDTARMRIVRLIASGNVRSIRAESGGLLYEVTDTSMKPVASRYTARNHRRGEQVLAILAGSSEPLTAIQIAKQIQVQPDLVRSALKRLVEFGQVKRTVGENRIVWFEAA